MKKKILVVEDSELLHRMYDLMFYRRKTEDLEVVHCRHGKEALDILRADPKYHIIILDLLMPVMDGWAFLENRATIPEVREIPVIIVSTEGTQGSMDRALKAGVAAYLTKPFQPNDLLRLMDMLLAKGALKVASEGGKLHMATDPPGNKWT